VFRWEGGVSQNEKGGWLNWVCNGATATVTPRMQAVEGRFVSVDVFGTANVPAVSERVRSAGRSGEC